jgi:hypothetical protein
MTREELTAIVAGIIQGVAVQGALQRGGRVDMKDLTIECVDHAELLVMEAAKSPEQRAEERTAREVARKMTAEAEAQAKDAIGTATMDKAAMQRLNSIGGAIARPSILPGSSALAGKYGMPGVFKP